MQPSRRVLLAVFALAANRLVTTATLIDALWHEEPSSEREKNLHTHIYQLRRQLAALEPGRAEQRLLTRDPGYQLTLGETELDLTEFTTLTAQGRAAARTGDAASAAQLLSSALGLWRGPALADARELSPLLAADAAALDEQRLAALEDRLQAELDAGEHASIADELAGLVQQYPFRERLAGQRMVALYRSGRTAEAVRTYADVRHVLADDLGIDPGPWLQDLHQRILANDAELAAPPAGPGGKLDPTAATGQAGATKATATPRQLPAADRHFAGRRAELAQLDATLRGTAERGGAVVITAIGGTGGIGKTTLALHWAHRVVDRFPDGQLFVNLRGYDPSTAAVGAEEAVRGFLEAMGVPQQDLPQRADEQAALYRSMLAGRRMLIVLDNAKDPAQVRPLLPASPGCAVLVTSRSRLAGLAATDGAALVPLDLPDALEAEGLLAARLGTDRLATEPLAAEQIIGLCARLPLALAITAARASTESGLTLAALADQLADEAGRLDALDTGEETTSMRSVMSWSVGQLSEPAATLFRLLGVHPGPDISVPAAASLAAIGRREAQGLLAELTRANLLAEPSPGRFAFHDLLRVYAAEQVAAIEPTAAIQAAIVRVLGHYLHSAFTADSLIHSVDRGIVPVPLPPLVSAEHCASREEAMAWFRAEQQVMVAAAAMAAATGHHDYAWQLPWTTYFFYHMNNMHPELRASCQAGLAGAEQLGDPIALAWSHYRLGSACHEARAIEDYLQHCTQAAYYFGLADDLAGQGYAHLGMHAAYFQLGNSDAAGAAVDEAVRLFEQSSSRQGRAASLSLAGYWHAERGNPALGRDYCERSAAIWGELDDTFGQAHSLTNLGNALHQLRDYASAIETLERALGMYQALGHRSAEADLYCRIGNVYESADNLSAARVSWQRSLDLMGDSYLHEQELIKAKLAAAEADARLLQG